MKHIEHAYWLSIYASYHLYTNYYKNIQTIDNIRYFDRRTCENGTTVPFQMYKGINQAMIANKQLK